MSPARELAYRGGSCPYTLKDLAEDPGGYKNDDNADE